MEPNESSPSQVQGIEDIKNEFKTSFFWEENVSEKYREKYLENINPENPEKVSFSAFVEGSWLFDW